METKIDQPERSTKKHKQLNKNKKTSTKADSYLVKKNKTKSKQMKTKAINDKTIKTKTISKTNKSKK